MNASNPDPGTLMLEGESVAQKYIDELTAQGVNKVVLARGAGLGCWLGVLVRGAG